MSAHWPRCPDGSDCEDCYRDPEPPAPRESDAFWQGLERLSRGEQLEGASAAPTEVQQLIAKVLLLLRPATCSVCGEVRAVSDVCANCGGYDE